MKHRNFDWPAFREFTFGTGGSGKSTAQRKRIEGQKARYYFIFDHKHEYGTKFGKKYCYSLDDLVKATAAGGWIVFDPCVMFKSDKIAAFKFFCNFVYEVSGELKGRKIFICDEVHRFVSHGERPEEFLCIMDDGRNFCLDVMCICQAGNSIHNEVRNQITEAYTFRQSDENAIKWLCGNGYDETQIRALRPGEYLWRDLANGGETRKGGAAFQIKPARKGSVRSAA